MEQGGAEKQDLRGLQSEPREDWNEVGGTRDVRIKAGGTQRRNTRKKVLGPMGRSGT